MSEDQEHVAASEGARERNATPLPIPPPAEAAELTADTASDGAATEPCTAVPPQTTDTTTPTGGSDATSDIDGNGQEEDFGATVAPLTEILAQLDARLETWVRALDVRLSALEEHSHSTHRQLRRLGQSIDTMHMTLSEASVRDILSRLLGIYDLVDQPLRDRIRGAELTDAQSRSYDVIRTQIHQLLEAVGLEEIPVDGPYDAQVHRSMGEEAVDDPRADGAIVTLVRPGFRAIESARLLRPAEVLLGRVTTTDEETTGTEQVGPTKLETDAGAAETFSLRSDTTRSQAGHGKDDDSVPDSSERPASDDIADVERQDQLRAPEKGV